MPNKYVNKWASSRGDNFDLYTQLLCEARNFWDNPRMQPNQGWKTHDLKK